MNNYGLHAAKCDDRQHVKVKTAEKTQHEIALREFVFDNRHKSQASNAMNYSYGTKDKGREKNYSTYALARALINFRALSVAVRCRQY